MNEARLREMYSILNGAADGESRSVEGGTDTLSAVGIGGVFTAERVNAAADSDALSVRGGSVSLDGMRIRKLEFAVVFRYMFVLLLFIFVLLLLLLVLLSLMILFPPSIFCGT